MSESRYTAPRKLWGDAVTYTRIDDDGKMWIGNGEYESQANYCPMTGVAAPTQMKRVDDVITGRDGIARTFKKYTNE